MAIGEARDINQENVLGPILYNAKRTSNSEFILDFQITYNTKNLLEKCFLILIKIFKVNINGCMYYTSRFRKYLFRLKYCLKDMKHCLLSCFLVVGKTGPLSEPSSAFSELFSFFSNHWMHLRLIVIIL